jgi:hypothetical protein
MVRNMQRKNMSKLASLLSVLALVLTAVAAAPVYGSAGRALGDATINGTVTDQNNGQPLAGVNVHLTGSAVSLDDTTDASGQYEFITAPDTFSLEFSKAGYKTKTAPAVGLAGKVTTVNAALEPQKSTVKGTVTSGANAVSGADVLLLGPGQRDQQANKTVNGAFKFEVLSYGYAYTVRVTVDGMYGYQASFTLGLGETNDMPVPLAAITGATSTVWGYVFDKNTDQPVEGARVTFTEKSGTQWTGTITGAGGYYSISLPAGYYDVRIEAPGYLSFSASVDVVEGATVQKDFSIRPIPPSGLKVSGKVTGGGVAGLAGAEVTLVDPTGARNSDTTDGAGMYSITTYAGDFTLEASRSGYFLKRMDITVAGSDLTENLALIPIPAKDKSVWGYTKDATGAPVPSARVVLYDLDADHTGYMVEATSSAGGYFSIPTYSGQFLLVGEAASHSTSVAKLDVVGVNRSDIVLDVLAPTDASEKLTFSTWGNISYTATARMPVSGESTRWAIDHNFGNGDGVVDAAESAAWLGTLADRRQMHRDTRDYLTVDGLRYVYVDGTLSVTSPDAAGNVTDLGRITVVHAYNLTSNASVADADTHALKFHAVYDTAAMTSETHIHLPAAFELRGTPAATAAVSVSGTSHLMIDPMGRPAGSSAPSEWVTLGIEANEVPFADTDGNKTVKPQTLVWFDASTSSDDTKLVNYTWAFGDGTFGYGVKVNHTYDVANGTPLRVFNVTLTITDTGGLTNTSTLVVTIDGQDPVAAFTADNTTVVEKTQLVEVNASGSSDNNGKIARYSWNFGDGYSGEGMATNHTYYVPGTYNLTLNVTDLAGNWATKMVQITVKDNTTPVARFVSNVSVVPALQVVEFNGTTSSDNVEVTQWVWSFGDGSVNISGNKSFAVVNHTYAAEGKYNVTLNVTDGTFWNETVFVMTVTAPLIFADLNISKISFSNQNPAADWDTVTISVKIRNAGEKAAENFTVRFLAGTKKIGDKKIRTLGIGQTTTVSMDWKPAKKGSYQVTVNADALSVVPESNEANNIADAKMTVKENQNSLIIGIIAVVVVLAIVAGYFLMKRRGGRSYDEDEDEEEEDEDEEEEDADEEEDEEEEDEEDEESECPKCFAAVSPSDKKCPSCGAKLRS